MEFLGALVVVVAVLVWYSFWTARRLDRLHARVDAAGAALDAQLRLRAEAAARYALRGDLPREAVAALAQPAEIAAEVRGLGHDREVAENALSRALIFAAENAPDALAGPEGAELADASARASFARRFHNDAVRDALVVRRRRVVRWGHLAGRAPLPAYFEMVDPALRNSEVAALSSPYD